MRQIIKNGTVFTESAGFVRADLVLEDGRINRIIDAGTNEAEASFEGGSGDLVIDAGGLLVLPGMVDIHFHGCAGSDFCDGTPEAFRTIGDYEVSHGITSICPATMTLPLERIEEICCAAAAYAGSMPEERNLFRGANLEGPFISGKKKGAQNPAYLMEPDTEAVLGILERSGGFPKIIDIAPELSGAMEFIRRISKEIRVSLAHTEADYDTACAAFEAGADHVTHLFNAMQPFLHRAPGLVGAAADRGAYVELIADGRHVHPSVIRTVFKIFGDRVVLISDSMEATGMPDCEYALGGQMVYVRGTLATLEDGTIAGSATNLYDCMVNAIRFGVPADEAIRAASLVPAVSIGIDDRFGSIKEGKDADLVIADRDYSIQKVLRAGEIRWEKQ